MVLAGILQFFAPVVNYVITRILPIRYFRITKTNVLCFRIIIFYGSKQITFVEKNDARKNNFYRYEYGRE